MKRLRGKQYFYWLGQLDANNGKSVFEREVPLTYWATKAYYDGFYGCQLH